MKLISWSDNVNLFVVSLLTITPYTYYCFQNRHKNLMILYSAGFCRLLHNWSCDDLLVLSCTRWTGVCKCILALNIVGYCLFLHMICVLYGKKIMLEICCLWKLENFSGDTSSSFSHSCGLCYVDWWRAALYLHGSHLWDDHPWDQFEMVIFYEWIIKWNKLILTSKIC